jgi:BirA family biotin operon repressor/biotin-[acetyl-CoA-carboxylase] ligase
MMNTKEKVLFALKENKEKWISGEELAQRLSLSRTAVWKHIKILKKEGYEIESSSRLGYLLRSSPNLMFPSEIRYGLKTKDFGKKIHYFSEIYSTNNKAKELAFAGASEGTLVIAEKQTGGRGRLGSGWFSPPGGIWFSLILRPQISPSDILKITLLASVAVAEAIQEATSLKPKIKWPNDILLDGKKLIGILTEMETEADTVHFIVLGIGINANIEMAEFPSDLRKTAISLIAALGKDVDRCEVLRYLFQRLEYYYTQLKSGNFSSILKLWKQGSESLGSRVRVETMGKTIEGKAVDINDQGALIVELDSGETKTIWSGDIVCLR